MKRRFPHFAEGFSRAENRRCTIAGIDIRHNFAYDFSILYMGHEKGVIPVSNGLSDEIAKEPKDCGFKYLDTVTVYSHLQDHQRSRKGMPLLPAHQRGESYNQETAVSGKMTSQESKDQAFAMIEERLTKPYWIIDVLPMQVPKDSPGQYFAVEKYLLENQLPDIKLRHLNVILKLNCYYDVMIDGVVNPPPEKLAEIIRAGYVFIMIEDAMILSESDDTHMTVFNPDEQLLALLKPIALSEGLLVWQPPQEEREHGSTL